MNIPKTCEDTETCLPCNPSSAAGLARDVLLRNYSPHSWYYHRYLLRRGVALHRLTLTMCSMSVLWVVHELRKT